MTSAPHIPYSRIDAAIRAGHLSFLLAHVESLSLVDEARVCRLIAEQQSHGLGSAGVRWMQRFGREASDQRLSDYRLIVEAFERFSLAPERSASELVALCAARGVDP